MSRVILNRAWKEIDRILWEVWDPIGVNTTEEARDEYQTYIPIVYAALQQGKSNNELNNILRDIEIERMGLRSIGASNQATIAALRQVEISGVVS